MLANFNTPGLKKIVLGKKLWEFVAVLLEILHIPNPLRNITEKQNFEIAVLTNFRKYE